MHFEKAEQTLAETVERLTKSKEKQLDILEKESEEHMKKTELYYRGLKESAEAKTVPAPCAAVTLLGYAVGFFLERGAGAVAGADLRQRLRVSRFRSTLLRGAACRRAPN